MTKSIDALLATELHTRADVERWMRDLTEAGFAWHPDDPASEIGNREEGGAWVPTFTPDQAKLADRLMSEARRIAGDDVYTFGLAANGGETDTVQGAVYRAAFELLDLIYDPQHEHLHLTEGNDGSYAPKAGRAAKRLADALHEAHAEDYLEKVEG